MNAFKTLGIEESSTFSDVKQAYRALSMKYHPDINGNTKDNNKKFYEITEAYNSIKSNLRKIHKLLDLNDECSNEEVDVKYYKRMDDLSFKAGSGEVKAKAQLEEIRKAYNFFKSSQTDKSPEGW